MMVSGSVEVVERVEELPGQIHGASVVGPDPLPVRLDGSVAHLGLDAVAAEQLPEFPDLRRGRFGGPEDGV